MTETIAIIIGYALLAIILLIMIGRACYVFGHKSGYTEGFEHAASSYGWLPPLHLTVDDIDRLPMPGSGGGAGAPLPIGTSVKGGGGAPRKAEWPE